MSHSQLTLSNRDNWEKLAQKCSHGAIYDSNERQPHSKCLPGTRDNVIEAIKTWDETADRKIVWVIGEPGSGKSTLAHTLADNLRAEGKLAGTFFFSPNHKKRNTLDHVFLTLAYQLGLQHPRLQETIIKAISDDPALLYLEKSPQDQLEKLIVQPLRAVSSTWGKEKSMSIVLDDIGQGVEGYPRGGLQLAKAFISSLVSLAQDSTLPIRTIIFSSDLLWSDYKKTACHDFEDVSRSIHINYYEPQNFLTKNFDEAEWVALRELRLRLPQVLSDAFPGSLKTREKPFNLWGITIDPLCLRRDARVSVVLMKFLREKTLDVDGAAALLRSTLQWRELFNVEAAVKKHFPHGKSSNRNVYYGKDRKGRPVGYYVESNVPTEDYFTQCVALIEQESQCVAFMEQISCLLDFETVDQVTHVHEKSMPQNISSKTCETLSHYPGLVFQTIYLDQTRYRVSSGFMRDMECEGFGGSCPCGRVDASSHKEYVTLEEMITFIDLPTRYGGCAKTHIDTSIYHSPSTFMFYSALQDSTKPAPRAFPARSADVSLQSQADDSSPMDIYRSTSNSPCYRVPALIASTSPMKISPSNFALVHAGKRSPTGLGSSAHPLQNETASASPMSISWSYRSTAQLEQSMCRSYVDKSFPWPTDTSL